MAIANAVQRGSTVHVYDKRGRFLFSQSGELHGFTGATVAIRRGNVIYVYDERGRFFRSRLPGSSTRCLTVELSLMGMIFPPFSAGIGQIVRAGPIEREVPPC